LFTSLQEYLLVLFSLVAKQFSLSKKLKVAFGRNTWTKSYKR